MLSIAVLAQILIYAKGFTGCRYHCESSCQRRPQSSWRHRSEGLVNRPVRNCEAWKDGMEGMIWRFEVIPRGVMLLYYIRVLSLKLFIQVIPFFDFLPNLLPILRTASPTLALSFSLRCLLSSTLLFPSRFRDFWIRRRDV